MIDRGGKKIQFIIAMFEMFSGDVYVFMFIIVPFRLLF